MARGPTREVALCSRVSEGKPKSGSLERAAGRGRFSQVLTSSHCSHCFSLFSQVEWLLRRVRGHLLLISILPPVGIRCQSHALFSVLLRARGVWRASCVVLRASSVFSRPRQPTVSEKCSVQAPCPLLGQRAGRSKWQNQNSLTWSSSFRATSVIDGRQLEGRLITILLL
jgi:hypothetical protein